MDPTGWLLADFANAYRGGTTVTAVIEATLALLDDAPAGVLIGATLRDRALADAAALDALDASGRDPYALFGVPFVVKDNIDVAHHPTTAGCPGYKYVAAADATVVALLRAAGAVVVGKANLDQFATGLVGTRSRTALRRTRSTSTWSPADPAQDRPSPSRSAWSRSRSAPTPPAPGGCPRR